ncbi:MAG: thioredoxin family protein [Phycisphaeraceae bacterium]|nr:thioredoxin family protein [Phycisphaeraceae bacterium]
MTKTVKSLFCALVVGAIATSASVAVAQDKPAKTEYKERTKEKVKETVGQEAGQEGKAKGKLEPAKVGQPAPNFTLTCTEGNTFNLTETVKSGKIVVLEWFNPDCPFIVKHHKNHSTLNDLHAKYSDKGVVFVAINSGAPGKQGAGKARNAKAKTDFKMTFPILIDESGDTGRAYGARTTPHMFIIDKNGVLLYNGAIDDDSGIDNLGKTNYVAKALDEILAGTTVSTPETRPYGCSVKY